MKLERSCPPLVSLFSLGCKLNQSETDSIATELQNRGFRITKSLSSQADYTVINTCTVTTKADRKSRNIIYRALRNAGALELQSELRVEKSKLPSPLTPPTHTKKGIVIVTGCFVGSNKKEIEGMKVDYIIDNSKKSHIPDIIDSHEQGQILDIDTLTENYFNYTPTENVFHVRSNLKIQDGCDNFCTFCIIPMVRGKAQSRPLVDIVRDSRTMLEHGTKEIVLTGVNMSRYSYEDYKFSDVLENLLTLPYDYRLRISSLEPDQIDDKFFELLKDPKICPHLHLCLQSGSERILMQMRRMYTAKEFVLCVDKIKQFNPRLNFTTDVIVGFPGETIEDFTDTRRVVEDCEFSHIHIFPYSNRGGTRASRMDNGIQLQVKKERIKTLEAINLQQKNRYRLAAKQSTQSVLIEKMDVMSEEVVVYGFTEYYIPVRISSKNNTLITIKSFQKLKNAIVPATLQGHSLQDGEIIMEGTLL